MGYATFYFSCAKKFATAGTGPDGVVGPPCNWIWDPAQPRAPRTWPWSWGSLSPCQCPVDVSQVECDRYRWDEYACDDVYQVHVKYICYGCCVWSCCINSSTMRSISSLICCISSYTIARWCGSTYSNCWNNSHKFIMRICSSSFNSNTANVFSWNA